MNYSMKGFSTELKERVVRQIKTGLTYEMGQIDYAMQYYSFGPTRQEMNGFRDSMQRLYDSIGTSDEFTTDGVGMVTEMEINDLFKRAKADHEAPDEFK